MQAPREKFEHAARGHAPKGPVWVNSSTPSVTSVALQTALKETRAYRIALLPDVPPSVVVYCSTDETGEEVGSEVRALRKAAPHAEVVVHSPAVSLPLARAALRAGARGFLHARMSPEQMARALSLVEDGEVVLPRELLEAAVHEARGPDLSTLSTRQLQVLELVAEGLTSAQIARRLWLSESTVKQHLRGAYRILRVKNRVQAAAVFRRSKPLGHASERRVG